MIKRLNEHIVTDDVFCASSRVLQDTKQVIEDLESKLNEPATYFQEKEAEQMVVL